MSKFKIGELVEAQSCGGVWYACEILETPRGIMWAYGAYLIPRGYYIIHVPGCIAPDGSNLWATTEDLLRRRRPPIPPEVRAIFEPRAANRSGRTENEHLA